MDIQTRKIEFIQKFLKIKDERIIAQFEELLKAGQTESKRKLKPFTEEELNHRIDQAERDFEDGQYKTTSELLEKFDL